MIIILRSSPLVALSFFKILDWSKCQQLSSAHALSAPAKSLKRAQLFFRASSFVRRLVLQDIPTMSPVMAQALVDVSVGSDLGPFVHKNPRRFAQRSLRLGINFESLFTFELLEGIRRN